MKFLKQIYTVLVPIFFQTAYADSEIRPFPRVTSSNNGSAYFTMLPDTHDYSGGIGRAYRLEKNGQSTKLWEVSGWYAHKVHISKNGRYLVREGNWARGRKLTPDAVAIVFYDQGVELKSYATIELVKDTSKITRSISHYVWRRDGCRKPQLSYQNEFCLRTKDNIEYIFDATTGSIISEKIINK